MTQKQVEKAIKAMCRALNYHAGNRDNMNPEIYDDLVSAGAIEEPTQEPVQETETAQEENN